MNLFVPKKIQLLLVVSLAINSLCLAQLNPNINLNAGQVWADEYSYSNIFQAREIHIEGANQAKAADAVRFSFALTQDNPCEYNNCPSEEMNTFSPIYYKNASNQWQEIGHVRTTNYSFFSSQYWDGTIIFSTNDSYYHEITLPGQCPEYQAANSQVPLSCWSFSTVSCGFLGLGSCLETSIDYGCPWYQWYHYGNIPSNCTPQGDLVVPYTGSSGNQWSFNGSQGTGNGVTNNYGNWKTYSFDWLQIPDNLYNTDVDFKVSINGTLVQFSMNLDRNWGNGSNEVLSDFTIETDDNSVGVVGPDKFSDCGNNPPLERWYGESQAIWGDSDHHLINQPNFSSVDFSTNLMGNNDMDANFGPDFTFDYKLHHKVQTSGCISYTTLDLTPGSQTISTQSPTQVENLIATNTADGYVRVEWAHPTNILDAKIMYTVTRKSIFDEITRTVFVSGYNGNRTNHTFDPPTNSHIGDGRFHFIDRGADPLETYLYTLNMETTYSNTSTPIIKSYPAFYEATGAGIPFFTSLNLAEEGTDIYIDTLSSSQCSQYLLMGTQEMIGGSSILLNGNEVMDENSVALSFNPEIEGVSKQEFELFENYNSTLEDLQTDTDLLVQGFNSNTLGETEIQLMDRVSVNIETNEFSWLIDIPADTYLPNSYVVYPVISATRSDGKTFRTFENVELDLYERGKPISPEIYDFDFDQFNVFEFSDQTNDVKVDEIIIQRIEILTEFTQKSRYMIYSRQDDDLFKFYGSGNPFSSSTTVNDSLGEGTLRITSIPESMREIQTVFNSETGTKRMIWIDQLEGNDKTQICVDYYYTVWVRNCQNDYTLRKSNTEVITPVQLEAIFEPVANGDYTNSIIDTDISTLKNISVSKGTHEDKIHISWDNLSDGIVNFFTIERRVFGDKGISSWQEIGVHTIGEKYFEDIYAQSNVLYEYRIQAWVGNCEPPEPVLDSEGNAIELETDNMQGGNQSAYQIGFRRPTARINGQVVFDNSTIPAPFVNVKAEVILDGGVSITNTSYNMELGYATFETPPFLNVNEEDLKTFTLSFWMNNTNNDDAVVFSRFSTEKWMNIEVKDNKIRYVENYSGWVDSTQFYDLLTNEDVYSSQNWNKITLSFDQNLEDEQLKFYVNGVLKDSLVSTFNPSSQDLINFGASYQQNQESMFTGLIDEVVISKALQSDYQIAKNLGVLIDNKDNDLLAYFPFDEGLGLIGYDMSANLNNNFNLRHLNLIQVGAADFSYNDTGFYSDYVISLSNTSVTNENGFYDIKAIRYPGDGSNFSITPYTIIDDPYPTNHEFNPPQATYFAGDQQKLIQQCSFFDLSSVKISTQVLFDVTQQNSGFDLIDKNLYQLPVEGVALLLNGKEMMRDGNYIVTDQDGRFHDIPIPLGYQCLSMQKDGYSFSYLADQDTINNNQFCQFYDFNMEPTIPAFSCNTYRELRGRVTGGLSYNSVDLDSIPLGFSNPSNTIGQVGFELILNDLSVMDDHLYKASVLTDTTSGEYLAKLLPLAHKINSTTFYSTNESVENYYNNQQPLFSSIDMSIKGEEINGNFVEDFLTSKNLETGDSIQFTKQYDIIYRIGPKISVKQSVRKSDSQIDDWTNEIGLDSVIIANQYFQLKDQGNQILGFPVFKQKTASSADPSILERVMYRLQISVVEEYFNYGALNANHASVGHVYYKDETGNSIFNPEPFHHAIKDGVLNINNTMKSSSFTEININDTIGDKDFVTYDFLPNDPYVFGANQDFKRKLTIDYNNNNQFAIWPLPVANSDNSVRGDVLLLGDKTYGNDFISFGPEAVDMILRDPYGDGSCSFIEEGSTATRTNLMSSVNGSEVGYSFSAGAGIDLSSEQGIWAGFGVGVYGTLPLGIDFQLNVGYEQSATFAVESGKTNEITISETFNDRVQTNEGDFAVGAGSDVFLGESKNLSFGTKKDLKFINHKECLLANLPNSIYECTDSPIINMVKKVVPGSDDEYSFELVNSFNVPDTVLQDDGSVVINSLYQFGTQKNANIGKGTNTKFSYSAAYIENDLIPKLIFLKNSYLNDPSTYNANSDILELGHPCWGRSIDSHCFDSIPNKRNYYTVPSVDAQNISMPVLSNYDAERLFSLIGQVNQEVNSTLNNVSTSGISDSFDSSLAELDLNGSQEVLDELTSLFGSLSNVSVESILSPTDINFDEGNQFTNFLNAAMTVTPNYADLPGVLNLEELMDNLVSDNGASSENFVIPKDLVNFYDQQIYLWRRALALNELDKINTLNSNFITNYSLDGGVVIEHSNTSAGSFTRERTISYDISGGYGLGVDMATSIFSVAVTLGVMFENSANVTTESTTVRTVETEETIGYTITDDDEGDVLSIDVRESTLGFGPIFSIMAGATSCPFEDKQVSRFLYPKHTPTFGPYKGLTFNNPDIYYDLNFHKSKVFFTDYTFPGGMSYDSGTNTFQDDGPVTRQPCGYVDYLNLKEMEGKQQMTPFYTRRLDAYNAFLSSLDNLIAIDFVGETPKEFSSTTSRKDKATISCNPINLFNVPEQEQAVFNFTITNESEDDSERTYLTRVVEGSNPFGAIIKIDGLSPNRPFTLDGASTIDKILTVEKGPNEMNYENLQLEIVSECGDDFDHSPTIISFSVSFLPTCTELSLLDKDDDWLVNISDSNLVTIELRDYDQNYYSFEKINLFKKFENGFWEPIDPAFSIVNPIYVINDVENYKSLSPIDLYNFLHSDFILITEDSDSTIHSFLTWFDKLEPIDLCNTSECTDDINNSWIEWNNAKESESKLTYVLDEMERLREEHLKTGDSYSDHEMISMRSSKTEVLWDIPLLPNDGTYQIKAKSDCGKFTSDPIAGTLDDVEVYSLTKELFTDRIEPQVFGAIQPIDGILNPNDEIIITFNEFINEIDFNISSAATFIDVKAVKNQTPTTYDSFLYFDGTDSLFIPHGVSLNESFSIEMWVRPESNGTLLYQDNGEDSEQIKLEIINYDDLPELRFSYTHPSLDELNEAVSIPLVLANNGFTHIGVSYNAELDRFTFKDGAGGDPLPEFTFVMDYVGEGSINVGEGYAGSMFDLRIWNKEVSTSDILANRFSSLSGTESNLIGYWPMNELRLNPQDKARYRHAFTSAEWAVDNSNTALVIDNNFVEFDTNIGIRSSSDFTIEGWFNTSMIQAQTIFSIGTLNNVNTGRWAIDINSGKMEVYHDDNEPLFTSVNSFNDGDWHHLAFTKNSNSNARLYVDGVEEGQINSSDISGVSGPLYFGRKVYVDALAGTSDTSSYYTGMIDEFRVWNIAKTLGQITSDMNTPISNEEIGLITQVSANDIEEFLEMVNIDLDMSFQFTENGPLIRQGNHKTSVAFHDVSNGDQIAIEILEPISKIENTTLEIKVQNVEDLFGNPTANPITFDIYVDRNQLIWDDQMLSFEKIFGELLIIETYIINQSGSVESFEISNLPVWMTAYPSSGLIEPNSFLEVEFIVDENLFMGDYNEDIILTGNNGYGERLELSLNVEMHQPEYILNPSDFQYAMNFVGKVSVDGIRSRDDRDLLFAYVDDELRGAADLTYVDYYDSYLVFLSVYSNVVGPSESINEEVKFRLWDASEGKFQSQVQLDDEITISFVDGLIYGDFSNPAHFKATNVLRQEITLNEGWNWVSFNLDAIDETDANNTLQVSTVMNNITPGNITQIKSKTEFANFDENSQTYYGSIMSHPNAPNGTLPINSMYMVNALNPDTIVYEGQMLNTLEHPIPINEGWNWLSYLGQRSMSINQTLSSLNPNPGDVVKSKTAFSMYASDNIGWLGSLNVMESGDGYMLKTDNVGMLIYPESSSFRVHSYPVNQNQLSDDLWFVQSNKFENSMNVIAMIDDPEYLLADDANLLGAFNQDSCVGNIHATKINEEESLYFISIYGELDDEISFKYLDKNLDYIFSTENTLVFEPNKLFGTIENPYPINLSIDPADINSTFNLNVYPNPFNENVHIEFTIDEDSYINLDLYDVTGRKIESVNSGNYEAGIHTLSIEPTHLDKGVYIIELLINEVKTRKVIVKS